VLCREVPGVPGLVNCRLARAADKLVRSDMLGILVLIYVYTSRLIDLISVHGGNLK
jgi:hypothetical protein